MLRNKGGFILIAVQIAVTMTIMVNAVAIIEERSRDMARPSGIDEPNTFTLASVTFTNDVDKRRLIDEDLEMIRNLPGVRNATASNSMPLRQGGWSEGLSLEPGADTSDSSSAIYFVDEHGLETFALNLIDGENFAPNQVEWDDPESGAWPAVTIVTQALAEDLFPGATGSYVGKTFYVDENNPVNIIGVVERMQAPWPSWSGVERAMLVPQRRDEELTRYIVRTEPGYRDELMPEIEEMLAQSSTERIIRSVRTMDDVRKMAYLGEAGMVSMLKFIVGLLTLITGLGIVGLASFNVSRRTRQIGIRRALGATRVAIVRYFMVENFLVSTIGIAAGSILAIGLNMWMVETFALEPLSWYVIPTAMIILWIVGQVAVAGPARRAANVTPAIATRSS
jgi:putative ABC transport system permease protein